MSAPVYYFGCWGGLGHFLVDPDHTLVAELPWCGLTAADLDSEKILPRWLRDDEGLALLTVQGAHGIAACTIMAFADRSVDTRAGSKAVFVAGGVHGFDAMAELARIHFPEVWARITARTKVRPLIP